MHGPVVSHLHVHLLLAAFAFLAALVPPVSAQVSPSTGGMLIIQTDPVVHALGEAVVARRGYVGAIDVNPASVGTADRLRVSTNVSGSGLKSPWLSRFAPMSIASYHADVKRGRWAAAYSFRRLDHERITPEDASSAYAKARDHAHKVAVAYDVRPALAVGAAIGRVHVEMSLNGSLTSFERTTYGLGARYGRTFERVSGTWHLMGGWSLTDLARNVAVQGQELPLMSMMRGGLGLGWTTGARAYDRSLAGLTLYGALAKQTTRTRCSSDAHCEADGPLEALWTSWEPFEVRTNATMDDTAEMRTVGPATQLIRQIGLEAALLETLSFRGGWFWESAYMGNRQFVAAGAGLDLYFATVDYSRVIWTDDNHSLQGTTFLRLALVIPLEEDGRNPWPALLEQAMLTLR